ncbi:hypothetical protein O181_022195 [Austropuccinia psidii MF-1]|uniref:Uncharacterized protein n=1 Tax=Austropuccinia psidii MF-1 TaxID=1389203 RepID=A0A9Q3CG14_9BASI|nr:hypothetical protein [Austropuccinia psidii MF-1]
MAHTIHLAAQEGISALSQPTPGSPVGTEGLNGPMAISNLIDKPDGFNLNHKLIISQITCLESYLHQSSQWSKKFATTVKLMCNDEGKTTKATSLLSHACTCWNLAYDMLTQAWDLKGAYNLFCSPPNLTLYCLSPLEWEKLNVLINFLHPLYEATQIICGLKYPTITHAHPLYLLLIKRINNSNTASHQCNNFKTVQVPPEHSYEDSSNLCLKFRPLIQAQVFLHP